MTAPRNAAVALLERPEVAGEPAILVPGGAAISYGALATRVRRFAGALAKAGLRRGDTYIVAMRNVPEAAVALLAGMRIGAVPVPTFGFAQPGEIAGFASRADAVGAILDGQIAGRAAELRTLSPGLRWILSTGGDDGDSAELDFAAAEACAPGEAEPADVGADELAMLCFSSGSTGTPKGLPHSHGNVLAVADSAVPRGFGGLGPGDRLLASSPFGFSYALAGLIFYPFRFGAASVFSAERMRPQTVARLLLEQRVTHWSTVPTLCAQLLQWLGAPERFPDLRVVKVGGMAASAELQAAFADRFGVEMLAAFGMQELIGSVLSTFPDEIRRGALGKSQPGCDAAILGEDERPVPNGTHGRLAVRADFCVRAYWRDPERTRQHLRPGGWLLTDDVAFRDADGFFHYVGRADQTIITSGWTVSPGEIEEVLRAHPAVAEAVALARQDRDRGAVPVAAVTLSAQATEAELHAHLRERLAAFKRPRAIAILPELPRTNSGKPALAEVRELVEQQLREKA